ncbi:Lrp/AsnC family transcriptional regulator [Actinoplanes sp. NPDC020271]|uniref:Lrp/AsnC family transcriptional regulator n=1 Tax=Actinoplanes sp. NPDC020271 TaxID=3363896 RepID=UPI00379AACF6
MLDEIDRALVHALHLDGRVPFSRVGAVLGVSPQTIARRYQRLRTGSSLRVVGLPRLEATGGAQWMLRLVASPASAQNLAHALVRRPDTSWVYLTSGGTEIVALVQADPDVADHSLLLRDIPRRSGITQVSAHLLLRTYRGGPSVWPGMADALTPEQQEQLRGPQARADGVDGRLEEIDRRLLAALARDGRATHTELGAAAGCTPVTAARRLAELRERGAVYFDVEFETSQLGARTKALLWMSVPPARLAHVAATLAGHRELAFVAVTTGRTNLVANALCDGPADLHDYLTVRLGELEAIQAIESAPVLRTLKASSPMGR